MGLVGLVVGFTIGVDGDKKEGVAGACCDGGLVVADGKNVGLGSEGTTFTERLFTKGF